MRLPSHNDRTEWHAFCFGRPPAARHGVRSTEAAAAADGCADLRLAMGNWELEESAGQQPSLPVLLSMDPVRTSLSPVLPIKWIGD